MLDFESIIQIPTPLTPLEDDRYRKWCVEVAVKRDDLTHAHISGNKFRKLKYNLLEAQRRGYGKLVTFGGAHSNHISAFAAACHAWGFKGRAIVRGEELNSNSSATLRFAAGMGIETTFVTRSAYRLKEKAVPVAEDEWLIPEGGTNGYALKGVGELVAELGAFDYLVTACGTGGTLAGLLQEAPSTATVIGVSVLKNGSFLREEVAELLGHPFPSHGHLETAYHFGGYAKYTGELIAFIKQFEAQHGIQLEQVYTAKAFFAFHALLDKGYFPSGSKVILLHTGGLQGRLPLLEEQ